MVLLCEDPQLNFADHWNKGERQMVSTSSVGFELQLQIYLLP